MTRSSRRRLASAFSLVEISIALGVAAFCLLAIVGLLQTGLTSEKATIGQTASGGILSMIYSDLMSTPAANTVSPVYQISLAGQSMTTPQTLYFTDSGEPTGGVGSAPTGDARYRATIGIQSPAAGAKAPTLARIVISWPAAADPQPNQWPVKSSGTVEVLAALDRP